jgi:hypothetical protein
MLRMLAPAAGGVTGAGASADTAVMARSAATAASTSRVSVSAICPPGGVAASR